MKLQKASTQSHESVIKLYIDKSIAELSHIKPYWAFGDDADKVLNKIQLPIHKTYKIFEVYTNELIENALFYEVNLDTLFTTDITNNYRIARILYNWENTTHLDPPTISLRDNNKELSFIDGRHRAKVSYLLGFKKIPIAVENIDIEMIRRIITLNEY
ncbi:hypothetical protein [Pedobacter sp. MR22-3]|uniref:hypothetical protein n=1 Tax=Pedobacter sp. MR22-3 TaxID=2994552 RepID=UPI002245137E|nr:hypothetical protein [Pedobacter sp. MR22-3]MCX2584524.1 hypothetical protein [Pedobacter sp. MR22-3]